jgi:hypothetical protein
MADTDELTDDTQDRVAAFQRQADIIQSMRNADAASYQPPGSPSEFLGREIQPMSPVSYFQANGQVGPMLIPKGAEGIRDYPGQNELPGGAQAAAVKSYNAEVGSQFPRGISGQLGNAANIDFSNKNDVLNLDVNNAMTRYPSAPQFQMPSTDQLVDAGIQAKRNAIQSEIDNRMVHLGQLPPSAIGASAVTLANERAPVTSVGRHGQTRYGASEADTMRAELAILQHSASNLDRAQAGVMQQNSRLALANAKHNEVYAQDTARGQVVDFLNNIDDTRYPHGSDDRQAFIGKVFGNRPDWLHVMAKDPHLAQYVQDHVQAQDKVASTMAQLKQLYPDEDSLPNIAGTRMVPSVNAKGQVSYRGSTATTPEDKEQSKLMTALHAQTGLTPDEFAAIPEDNVKAGGIVTTDAQGKKIFHIEGGGFNVNGTPKGEFNNDFTNFIDGYKPGETQITPEQEKQARGRVDSSHAIQIDTGKGYKTVIPRINYERYREAFSNGQGNTTPAKKVLSVDDWLNQ